MSKRHPTTGGSTATTVAVVSPSPEPQPQPVFEQATVRHIVGFLAWILTTDGDTKPLRGTGSVFETGLMTNPVFNANAPVIDDLWCGTDNKSEASATGMLWKVKDLNDLATGSSWPEMPADAIRVDDVGYDKTKKFFFGKSSPGTPLVTADYLFLADDGTAKVGWKTAA